MTTDNILTLSDNEIRSLVCECSCHAQDVAEDLIWVRSLPSEEGDPVPGISTAALLAQYLENPSL